MKSRTHHVCAVLRRVVWPALITAALVTMAVIALQSSVPVVSRPRALTCVMLPGADKVMVMKCEVEYR